MSSVQNQKSNVDNSLSFEDASKLFSLPLSEAADILGVSTSVLKKICNENGLERWPHRKYLAGKSIEDIKKEAAKEKSKALGGISSKSPATTPLAAASSPGSHTKDKSTKSTTDSESYNAQLQLGSKNTSNWRSHHMLAPDLAIESSNFSDEFKYGFPSTGLSKYTNRWWGSSSEDIDGVLKDDIKTSFEAKDASKVQLYDGAGMCEKKTDSMEEDSECDKGDEFSLSAIRKRALEEGKKALNLRCLKKYGADKLENEEKILLRRLYQTS